MNKYAGVITVIITVVLVYYLAVINSTNTAVIKFAPNAASSAVNTSVLIMFMYVIGLAAGAVQAAVNKAAYRSRIEFYERKNDKLAQQNEIDTDDKETLQRKIAALEAALEKALHSKD